MSYYKFLSKNIQNLLNSLITKEKWLSYLNLSPLLYLFTPKKYILLAAERGIRSRMSFIILVVL